MSESDTSNNQAPEGVRVDNFPKGFWEPDRTTGVVPTPRGMVRRSRVLGVALVVASMLLALGVLVLGWCMDVQTLIRLRPAFAGMAPSTAVLFVVSGGAAWLMGPNQRQLQRWRWFVFGAAVLLWAVALPNFWWVTRGHMDLDARLFGSLSNDGRVAMSPATSLAFLMVGAALGAVAWPFRCIATWPKVAVRPVGVGGKRLRLCRDWQRHVFVGALVFALAIGLVALIGYAFDARAMYANWLFTAMALHTALGFVLLALGMQCRRPFWGWLGVVVGDGVGSRGVRRLLPTVVLCPLVLAWLALLATRKHWFVPEFRLCLLATVSVFFLMAMLVHNGLMQNRSERRMQAAVRALQTTVSERDMLLRELNHRVKNNLQQIAALLYVEANDAKTSETRDAMETMSGRVQALATVHDMLLDAIDHKGIALDQFLKELCAHASVCLGAAERGIGIAVSVDPGEVSERFAVPLGLLVNEALANACKHAFVGTQGGRLFVGLAFDDAGNATLTVRDDGIGLGEAGHQRLLAGHGMQIIHGLAQQMRGQLEIKNGKGVTLLLRVPKGAIGRREAGHA